MYQRATRKKKKKKKRVREEGKEITLDARQDVGEHGKGKGQTTLKQDEAG